MYDLYCSDITILFRHPFSFSLVFFLFSGRQFLHRRRAPFSTTLGDSTREVSVLLLTGPLLAGHYAGKTLPRSCVFPELLQTFEGIHYRCLGSRLTSLDSNNAERILDVYSITDMKKRYIMVKKQQYFLTEFLRIIYKKQNFIVFF